MSLPVHSLVGRPLRFRRCFSSPDFSLLGLAAFSAGWCVALWFARRMETGTGQYFYLVYNLGLAVLPLVFSSLAVQTRSRSLRWLLWSLWLAFFPNAPYLITDLIHLRPRPEAPFWFDWLLMVSFSGAGFLIGTISLSQAHRALCRRLSALRASLVIWLIIVASAFGIYLGRFPRWNSWDIAARPGEFFSHVGDLLFRPWEHPVMLAYSFGVTVLLGCGYFGPMLIARSVFSAGETSSRFHGSLPEKGDGL